jgi:histidine triad (HIT) family protein
MLFSKKVAHALEATIDCKRVGMAVVGLEVPHVHVHLIPLQTMDDIRFEKKDSFTEEEFKEIARSISENVKL